MTPVVPAHMRRSGILPLILLLLAGLHSSAAADEWTAYAYPNDLQDIVAVGRTLWMATTGGALSYDTEAGQFRQSSRRAAGGPVAQELTSVCYLEDEGLLFFGSAESGVSEYDVATGRWQRFEFIPDNHIQRLSCLGGEVYIATQSGFTVRRSTVRSDICNEVDRGLCCGADPDTCFFPSFNVHDFTLQGDRLWTATGSGPAENDGSGWLSRTNGAPVSAARSLAVYNGRVFLATASVASVFRWNSGTHLWEAAGQGLHSNFLVGEKVRLKVLPTSDGTGEELWVGTEYGAFRWNGSGWTAVGLEGLHVRGFASVPGPGTERVVYAATHRGLHRYNGGSSWTQILAPGPPIDIRGQAIDVDGNGVVWIGTLGGPMSVTPDGVWAGYPNGQNNLDGSAVYSIFADSQNRLWLGKCCCRTPPSCPVQFIDDGSVSPPVSAWDGWGIAEDSQGRMWIGSNTTGVHVLDAGGTPIVTLTPSNTVTPSGFLRSSSVRAVAVQGNKVWLGHEDKGLQIVNTGGNPANPAGYTWKTFTGSGSSDLPDATVADIALEGSTGWVLTSAYLVRFDNDTRTGLYALNEGGEPRRGTAVDVDRRGNKWVATSNGVIRVDRSGHISVFNTSNSDLISNDVVDVAIDPLTGDVLFETTIGASRLRPGSAPPSDSEDLFAFPNPFQPGSGGVVKLGGGSADNARVMDLLGRPVAVFDPEVGWDGLKEDGTAVPPGIYLITAGGETLRLAVLE